MVFLEYISEGFDMSPSLMEKIRRVKLQTSLLEGKKLVLVLDLDHTLLHSIDSRNLKRREDKNLFRGCCNNVVNPRLLHGLHRVPSIDKITKLRPGVSEFLKQASDMFELYVYTMGSRSYAQEMVQLLDPESRLLNRRKVIAKQDCTAHRQKNLDVLLADERVVVILDDTEDVWVERCRRNLITMPKYFFFWSGSHSYRRDGESSAAERMVDEEDSVNGNALMAALDLLRSIHRKVFDECSAVEDSGVDVRRILDRLRKEGKLNLQRNNNNIKGCKIDFRKLPSTSLSSGEVVNRVEKRRLIIRLKGSLMLRNASDRMQEKTEPESTRGQMFDSRQRKGGYAIDSAMFPSMSLPSGEAIKSSLKKRLRLPLLQAADDSMQKTATGKLEFSEQEKGCEIDSEQHPISSSEIIKKMLKFRLRFPSTARHVPVDSMPKTAEHMVVLAESASKSCRNRAEISDGDDEYCIEHPSKKRKLSN